jgi:hypothetical protein
MTQQAPEHFMEPGGSKIAIPAAHRFEQSRRSAP